MEKSNLSPSQEIMFLGYTIRSKEQKIVLPQEKVNRYGERMAQMQTNLPVTISEIISVLKLMTASILAVRWARFHQKTLKSFLLQNLGKKDYGGGEAKPIYKKDFYGPSQSPEY